MANRYWVGGTAAWDATAGLKWATTSGGVGGAAVPTSADDVFFDAASGVVTVTFSLTRTGGRSLNFTGFTGTFVHAAGATISIGDATAGAGNVALKMVPGMTYTKNALDTSAFLFISTSPTQQTIDVGGKLPGNVVINGVGSNYIAVGPFYAWILTLTAGTFALDQSSAVANILVGFSSTGVLARTFTMTGRTIWLSGAVGTIWDVTSSLTLNAVGSLIVFFTVNWENRIFVTGGLTYGSFLSAADSFGQVTFTGGGATFLGDVTIGRRGYVQFPPESAGGITIIGNLIMQGVDDNYQRYKGLANCYVLTPDSVPLSVVGDLDIRVKVSLDDWSPASNQLLAGKLTAAGGWSWIFYVLAAGNLVFAISTNGTSLVAGGASTVVTGIADGTVKWVRVTRRKSDGRQQFFTSNDGAAWTQLGADVIVAANTNIWDSTAVIELGTYFGGAAPLIGNLYVFDMRNNILNDGSGRVAYVDFATWGVGYDSLTDPHGNVWTKVNLARYGDGRILAFSGALGIPWGVTKPNGFVDGKYLHLYDCVVKGGAHFYAGALSKIEAGVKGWNLTDKPVTEQRIGMAMR